MMDFVKRRIRDNLHGSIDISTLEDKIIAHPYFQRLRRIKQTAFLSYAFPGATHTRFEHSLGVMHLAGKSWKKIISNQKRLKNITYQFFENSSLNLSKQTSKSPNLWTTFFHLNDIEESSYAHQALRLAALFHDVGHPPLSHTGEVFLETVGNFLKDSINLPDYLKTYLLTMNPKEKVSHEVYSILILDKILSDLYRDKTLKNSLHIQAQDIASIINLSIKPKTTSDIQTLNLQHIFHELISGEVDVDRMDYLLRDSNECGVIYGMFDLDRILDSLSMFYHPEDETFHLALKLSGLPAFEDFLRARQSMYLQVYLHKTSVACDSMLQFLSEKEKKLTLPLDLDDYCHLDDYTIQNFLKDKILQNKSSLEEKEKRVTFLEDLFLKRKLWKNVYETSFTGEKKKTPKELKDIIQYLNNSKIEHHLAYYKNSLTSLKKETSTKYPLMLIHKDHKMRYELTDLNKFSSLTRETNTRNIVRIYVERKINREKIIEILNPVSSES